MKSYKNKFNKVINELNKINKKNQLTLKKQNFKGKLKKYEIEIEEYKFPTEFIKRYIEKIYHILNEFKYSIDEDGITYEINFNVQFKRTKINDNEIEYISKQFSSIKINQIQFNKKLLEEKLNNIVYIIDSDIEDFVLFSSDWLYDHTFKIEIVVYPYQPLSASKYIKLPIKIKNKKCCINVKNNDDYCFKWAILSALHPQKKDPQRLSKYIQYENELKFGDLSFPIMIDNISKFEKLNNISINVLGYDEKNDNFNIYYYTEFNYNIHINLLLIEKIIDGELYYHYVWIKNITGLLRKHNDKNTKYNCLRCLNKFHSKLKLENHKIYCQNNDFIKTILPNKNDKIMKFNHIQNTHEIPYKLYCDFECYLSKDNLKDNQNKTTFLQNHKISGYCMVLINNLTNYHKIYMNSGINAFDEFMNNLLKIKLFVENEYDSKNAKPYNLTNEERLQFNNSDICYLCNKKLFNDKVIDHCHFTGSYRGPCHYLCNINYRIPKLLPVIFHNLRGYDSHVIFENIGSYIKNHNLNINISAIPTNMQKFMSFSITDNFNSKKEKHITLKFIDSFQFLSTSIETLSNNLENNKKFITNKYLHELNYNDNQIKLLLKKGTFPYSWFDSLDKLNYNLLPDKEDFYDNLNEKQISDKKYNHAINVWNKLNIKSFKEYHDIYMLTDTLLLSDIFNNFCMLSLEKYHIDPCYYLSMPGMSFDAFLKYENCNIELITDINQFLMFENQIRGGISMVFKRYSKANNKYLIDYDNKKPSKYILYIDRNNLYGEAMSMKLPLKNFKEFNIYDWDEEKIKNYDFDSHIGITFDVDLKYPFDLHNKHQLPFAPERIYIENEFLSQYQKEIMEKLNLKRSKVKKLIPNYNDKINYIVHGKLLQFYLNHGMKIKKINYGVQYYQESFMKSYIDFNSNMRAKSKNDFEKDMYKLMNNSIFGKSMEDLRKRFKIKILTDDQYEIFKKLNSKNLIKGKLHQLENLVILELKKLEIKFDKPLQIGASILDLSKLIMYQYFYDYLIPKYNNNVELLYMDTDSYILEITCDNLYEDMKIHKNEWDMSGMKINELNDKSNSKKLGFFKDETNGIPIREFVALRSKSYSILIDDVNKMMINKHIHDLNNNCELMSINNDKQTYKLKINNEIKKFNFRNISYSEYIDLQKNEKIIHDEKKKNKGSKKYIVQNQIKHEDYINTLKNLENMNHTQNCIKSIDQNIFTLRQSKTSLSCFDDKKYILNDGINSLCHGHYKTKLNKKSNYKIDYDNNDFNIHVHLNFEI